MHPNFKGRADFMPGLYDVVTSYEVQYVVLIFYQWIEEVHTY